MPNHIASHHTSLDSPQLTAEHSRDSYATLKQAIEHASHFLPAQGPITVFIHHNTLHAFEELPFTEGVVAGSKQFNCQPYLAEDHYREKLAHGRISVDDLVNVLEGDLGGLAVEPVVCQKSRLELRLAMLQYPLRVAPPAELHWFVAETDALSRFRDEVSPAERDHFLEETRHWVMRELCGGAPDGSLRTKEFDGRTQNIFGRLFENLGSSTMEGWNPATWETFTLQALWRICREGVAQLKPPLSPLSAGIRPRDALLDATGVDSDLLVHDVLMKYCAAFLDQGLSDWPLPLREQGFYEAFLGNYRQAAGPPDAWLRSLPQELSRLARMDVTPQDSILESLERMGIPEAEWETFITASLLSLRGWAGMVWQMELRADRVAYPVPPGSLVGFLAVRLILERLALGHLSRESLGFEGPLQELRDVARRKTRDREAFSIDQRAFTVFQLAQVSGWLPSVLYRLTNQQWAELFTEIDAFPAIERRRVFHAAFERRYRVQSLDAMSLYTARPVVKTKNPKFQLVCCLDEREESFRRHLEEIEPQVETFGAAGFYSVAMYYRGTADASFVPLCPIIIQPKHWVVEDVAETHGETHDRLAKVRRVLGVTSHRLHVGTRTLAGGALIAGALGALSAIPLVARVLFPWLTSRIRRAAGRLVQPTSHTDLRIERTAEDPSPEDGHIGFSLDEMAMIGERLLRDIGLIANFARLVVFLGHGSNSLNNPHNSAYNCGACGGGGGGPNARALAKMLNDPRVRHRLHLQGIELPEETRFLGGFHNTCNDEVTFRDLDSLPASHQSDFRYLQEVIAETCDRNAHERCRRFQSAPLNMPFRAARRHVEARSEDLAQTRPECGHASNALCFVGRRERSRGLFLDRRTFLASYDPTQDNADDSILVRILQAAIPVCAGINLEYYFSYVDPTGWGCGTKLPHNVTSLLGVMDGAASDLRTGLPWQMVEIHDPVRLMFIIETSPDAMQRIMDRHPAIGNLCRNGWVQLATLSPDSNQIHLLCGERFEVYRPEEKELPHVKSSVEWYRGWRDHLGYAVVRG